MTIVEQLPYIVLMIFSSLVSMVSAVSVFRSRRKVTRANSFAMMAICAAVWMLLTTLALIVPNLAWKEVLWALIPFAILTSLTGLFFFSLEFSLRLRKVPKAVLLPTVTLVMVIAALSATNPLHHLAWKIVIVDGNLTLDQGIVYQVQMIFAYLFAIIQHDFTDPGFHALDGDTPLANSSFTDWNSYPNGGQRCY